MRPALIFKRAAASGIWRPSVGPFLRSRLLRRALVPVVPSHPSLRFQGVHSEDVGEAFRLALVRPVRGALNLAADPVLDGPELARLAHARSRQGSGDRPGVRRAGGRRAPPPAVSPGWVDLGFGVPLMECGRAWEMLGGSSRHTAAEALKELVAGFRDRAGTGTPPLEADAGGPLRSREIESGVGEREG